MIKTISKFLKLKIKILVNIFKYIAFNVFRFFAKDSGQRESLILHLSLAEGPEDMPAELLNQKPNIFTVLKSKFLPNFQVD